MPTWGADYRTAVNRFDDLQEAVAKGSAARQWFLDKNHNPAHIRLSFPLWEKKVWLGPSSHCESILPLTMTRSILNRAIPTLLISPSPEKMMSCELFAKKTHLKVSLSFPKCISNNFSPAKQTAQYCSYLPDQHVEVFRIAAKTHHIKLPPVFFADGTLVEADELAIRLDNALIEVMFTLKHYYYPANTGQGSTKFKPNRPWGNNQSEGNTFTATIAQVRILKANTAPPSPLRQPTLKPIQETPPPKKNQILSQKRRQSLSPSEASPSRPKKPKNQGISYSSFHHNKR